MKTFYIFKDGDEECVIYLIADGVSFVPNDPANSDYQQYLAWVAEGNTAEEWSPDATV
jgi:hypothetical protein